MLTNMSEIMSKKISVLDISIDNFTAKEAMQEALAYMESDLVSVIELVTIESLMELGTEAELKKRSRISTLYWLVTRQFWKQQRLQITSVCERRKIRHF